MLGIVFLFFLDMSMFWGWSRSLLSSVYSRVWGDTHCPTWSFLCSLCHHWGLHIAAVYKESGSWSFCSVHGIHGGTGPFIFHMVFEHQELWVECEVYKILKGKVTNKSLVVLIGFSLVGGGKGLTGLQDSPKLAGGWAISQAWPRSSKFCVFIFIAFSLHFSLLWAQVVWMEGMMFRVGARRGHVLNHDVFLVFWFLFVCFVFCDSISFLKS